MSEFLVLMGEFMVIAALLFILRIVFDAFELEQPKKALPIAATLGYGLLLVRFVINHIWGEIEVFLQFLS